MIKKLVRWVLRHDLARARQEATMWKQWALVQQRYREEVHGETPAHEGFRAWFHETYPEKTDLPAHDEYPQW